MPLRSWFSSVSHTATSGTLVTPSVITMIPETGSKSPGDLSVCPPAVYPLPAPFFFPFPPALPQVLLHHRFPRWRPSHQVSVSAESPGNMLRVGKQGNKVWGSLNLGKPQLSPTTFTQKVGERLRKNPPPPYTNRSFTDLHWSLRAVAAVPRCPDESY